MRSQAKNVFVTFREDILYRKLRVWFKDDDDISYDSNWSTQEVQTFYENLCASHENDTVNFDVYNVNTPALS